MRKKQKDWAMDMAHQRIIRLFELAGQEFKTHPERSDRYVRLARRIGMRYRVRIPEGLKPRICKHCHAYLVQGVTARTRLQGTHIATTCTACGKQMRHPYHR
jgi:ribonuclease P protein subunit RPR2